MASSLVLRVERFCLRHYWKGRQKSQHFIDATPTVQVLSWSVISASVFGLAVSVYRSRCVYLAGLGKPINIPQHPSAPNRPPMDTGISIFRQLRNSSAGQFQQAHADHGQTSCLSLLCSKLPTTVIVGDSKVGKSSLLSCITRCAIFHGNSCTKMPVRVQLVQVSVQPEQAVSVIFQEQHLTYEIGAAGFSRNRQNHAGNQWHMHRRNFCGHQTGSVQPLSMLLSRFF